MRSAGTGRGGTRVDNRVRKRPRLLSAARALPLLLPSLLPIPGNRDPHELLPGEGTAPWGWRAPCSPACALLFRFPLPSGAWAQLALGAAFPQPGLLRPSLSPLPLALLSSFPAISQRGTRLPSTLFLQAPGEAEAPRPPTPVSYEAEGSAFT